MSNQPQQKKSNTNPTHIPNGVPVLIYLTEQEIMHMSTLAKALHSNFKAQNQKFLKTDDIREFVKFASMAYYNMVILKLNEEKKQREAASQQQQQPAQQQGYL